MPNLVTCPSCSNALRVPDELLDRDVRCPACGATFQAVLDARAAPAETAIEDLPRRAPARAPDYDEDYDNYERRRTRPRRHLEPHRGVLILVLGIVSLVFAGIIIGPIAWVMGNNDLKAIRAGRMDPEGEQMTNAGRICGMIATLLGAIGLVFACVWIVFVMSMIAAGK